MGTNISDEELEEYALKRHNEEEDKRLETEAEGRIQEIFSSIKKVTEETLKDNKPNAIMVNYRMQCFLDALLEYTDKKTQSNTALDMKSVEIFECACDSFYLSVGGRYRTAYILMRKMLELFAMAEYIDTSGTFKSKKAYDWIFSNDKPPILITKAISGIDKNDSLKDIYDELCSFAHNDGTKDYELIWDGFYKKEGFDLYVKKMVFLSDYLCNYLRDKKHSP